MCVGSEYLAQAYEIRGKVTSVISPVVPAKRSTETPVMSIKGEQDRKIAPDRVVQASKSTTEAISSKAAIKSKSPAKSAPSKVKLAPETVPNPAAVLRPVTPQRTVQFSSPALQAGRASADFVYPISTQRRAFLTAGVESSPSSSDPILVVRPIVPSQNQLSIRSSQVVVHQKPRSEQKRARASASQVVSVKKQKKGHRVSRARIEEVEDETEDRLSAALEDLFTVRLSFSSLVYFTDSTMRADDLEERRKDEHPNSKNEICFPNVVDSKSDGDRATKSSPDVSYFPHLLEAHSLTFVSCAAD